MATVYVDPAGQDTNTGSVSNPVKTLGRAQTIAAIGDTILVDGDASTPYVESIAVAKSGVTFAAVQDTQPLLDGGGLFNAAFTVGAGRVGITIKGFEIANYLVSGISVTSVKSATPGHALLNNHIHHISGEAGAQYGIYMVYGDSLVRGNHIHHIGPGSESMGIWAYCCKGHKIDANEIYAVRKDGIRDYFGLLGEITSNRVYLCWVGVALNESAAALVANNFLYYNTTNFNPKHTNDPYQPSAPGDPTNGVLYYWGLTDTTVPEWSRFWHNTCFTASHAAVQLAINLNSNGINGFTHQVDMRNNIFAGYGADRLWDAPAARTSSLVIDYNLYSSVDAPVRDYRTGYNLNAAYKTFAEMQTDLGWEVHGRIADPQFLDIANHNFDYAGSSPAASGGATLPSAWSSQVGARGLAAPHAKFIPAPATVLTSQTVNVNRVRASDGLQPQYFQTATAVDEWMVFDYGVPVTIDTFVLDVYNHGGNTNVKGYLFEIGDDPAGPWTTVLSGENADAWGASIKYELEPVLTRYVRFTAVSSFGGATLIVSDLRAGWLTDPPAAPIGGTMSIFTDSFTGTAGSDLTAHTVTGGSGGPWARHPDKAGTIVFDTAGTALSTSVAAALYQPSTFAPPSTDYRVVAVMRCRSFQSSGTSAYIGARVGVLTAELNGYYMRFLADATTDGAGTWSVVRFSTAGATGTTLISYHIAAGHVIVGGVEEAWLDVVNSASDVQINLYVAGALVGSYLDMSASKVTRVGKPVIYSTGTISSTAGYHLSVLTVEDLTPLVAPVNTVAPAVTGTAQAGRTLACSAGTWSNFPASFAYQWKRGVTPISGATSSTYTLQVADVGLSVTCVVTAINSAGSTPATSNAVTPIALPPPACTVLPLIGGYAETGTTLICTSGAWDNLPSSYAYQWKLDGAAIGGATSSTYLIQLTDAAHAITCVVTATNITTSTTVSSSNSMTPIRIVREDPVPASWSRTVVFFGDVHTYVTGVSDPLKTPQQQQRLTKVAQTLSRVAGRGLYDQPAAYVQIGDQTEDGLTAEYTAYNAFLAAIPGSTKHTLIGNHDVSATGNTPDIASWEANAGVAEMRAVDIGGVIRLIFFHWSLSVPRQTTLTGLIEASTLPTLLLVHYPLRDTHGPGTPPHDSTDTLTPYQYCPSAGTDDFIKAVSATHSNVVGVVSGHTHCWYDCGNFAALKDVGSGVSIPVINVSALAYLGGSQSVTANPLVVYTITLGADNKTLEVRMRDVGSGVWWRWPTGEHSRRLTRVG